MLLLVSLHLERQKKKVCPKESLQLAQVHCSQGTAAFEKISIGPKKSRGPGFLAASAMTQQLSHASRPNEPTQHLQERCIVVQPEAGFIGRNLGFFQSLSKPLVTKEGVLGVTGGHGVTSVQQIDVANEVSLDAHTLTRLGWVMGR